MNKEYYYTPTQVRERMQELQKEYGNRLLLETCRASLNPATGKYCLNWELKEVKKNEE